MAEQELEEEKKKSAKNLARSKKKSRPLPKNKNKEDKKEKEDFLGFSVDKETKAALSYFLPQAIGALGGGLFEGTEGALAGMDAGEKAARGLMDQRLGEARIGAEEARAEQIALGPQSAAPYTQTGESLPGLGAVVMDRRTGQKAVYDPQAGGLRPLSGNEVQKLQDTQTRFDRRQGLTEAKAAELSPKQVEDFQQYENVLGAIDRIEKLKDKVDTGPVAGIVGSARELVGMQPEGFTELKAETNDSLAKYVQSISGAQVSEQEAQRLGRIIPNVSDDEPVFDAKLKVFKQIIKQNAQNLQKAIESGQPLKKLQGLDAALDQVSGVAGPARGAQNDKGLDIDKQLNLIRKIKAKRGK